MNQFIRTQQQRLRDCERLERRSPRDLRPW